jgi:uncharacterized protein (TIGR02646 family)
MRKIDKSNEPTSLAQFRINNLGLKYIDLANGNENIRIDIRESCVNEQFFLCAYCCDRITITSSHNEHIIPQNSALGQNLTLDYNNIVASCQSIINCGHKKDNNLINLTPLMIECEDEIIFQLNGKMTHTTPRAQETINRLNLRNRGLENKRKQVIDIILFEYVEDLDNLNLEENYYLELIIAELSQVDNSGKLEAFSPVIINVLRQFLA